MSKEEQWEDFEKNLNISQEEEEEIKLEMEIIKATLKLREDKKISQIELSKITGLKQSAIARIENAKHSPTINTLIKILHPMGYTLGVVPIKKNKNN